MTLFIRIPLLAAFMLVGVMQVCTFAAPGQRVALVMGNGNYEAAPALPNPVSDATAMADTLKAIGFTVVLQTNLDGRRLRSVLRDFETLASGADIALVFYAGHGMAIDGVNYLIPVDAQLARDTHVQDEAVSLGRVLEALSQTAKLRIVMLDACRNNPFLAKMQRSLATRAISRGLVRVEPEMSTIISYAADEGQTAADGNGRHSPYTTAMIDAISKSGYEVNDVFRDVNEEVRQITNGEQRPVYFASLGRERIYLAGPPRVEQQDFDVASAQNTPEAWDIFLKYHTAGYLADVARTRKADLEKASKPPAPVDTDKVQRPTDAELPTEELYWRTIKTSPLPADFKAYIRRFPNGAYVDLANQRMKALQNADEVKKQLGAEKSVMRRNAMAQIDRIPKNLIQYGLNALGFPVDEVSGVIDSSTHRAIREYQSSIGEPQTGDLTAQQTVDLLLAAAATGDPHAQNAVGYMVAKGVGLTIDYDAARGWLGKAAKQDDPYALMNLALLYRDGLGVPKDVPQARQLLARAKDRGLSDAGSMLREIEAR